MGQILRPSPLSDTHQHMTDGGKPTKDFFNWLKKVSSSMLTPDSSDALTNKTITDSSNVLGGVTMTLGSDADGDIYYRSGGVLTRLPKGTNGQVLSLSSGVPNWETISLTPVTILNTLTPSNVASIGDTTSFTSTYPIYEIALDEIVPATSGAYLYMRVHESGAYQTGAHYYSQSVFFGSAAAVFYGANNATAMTVAQSVQGAYSGVIRVNNPSVTTHVKRFVGSGTFASGTTSPGTVSHSGWWNNDNNAIDGFQLYFSSGNITSGTIYVRGIK